MDLANNAWHHVLRLDSYFADVMAQHWFTNDLIHNPVSRIISEILFVTFVFLLAFESLYWSGIYLGLWEYHAKDIFTEVPVHCAHVYVRVNVATEVEKVRLYYQWKQNSTYNIWSWKRLNELGAETFGLAKFVKYHFEFSPEDFENNPQPEFGSTVEHLRQKILATFVASALANFKKAVTSDDVMVFNSRNAEVGENENKTYLSKIHIETGNVVDAIIVC